MTSSSIHWYVATEGLLGLSMPSPFGPSAKNTDVQICSRQTCIRASCPHPFGAALRAFKIVPDNFVKLDSHPSPINPNFFGMGETSHSKKNGGE